MFDTRSGFWLMASIGILALLATAAVIFFAPDDELTYSTFAAAIGIPMTVILPIIAILSVTGEWSQRSGLTTFTLVPHRGRVIPAKALVVGRRRRGRRSRWPSASARSATSSAPRSPGSTRSGTCRSTTCSPIVLANVLGLLVGFMLGVLIRSSAGAIVAYFVYSFLLPTLAALLAGSQDWFRDLQPWVDFNFAQSALFDGALTAEQWAQLGGDRRRLAGRCRPASACGW